MPFNEWGAKWIRRERRLALYMRDGFRCVYCGCLLLDFKPDDIELDHVDGVEYFGAPIHTNDNLVTCCKPCNRSKADKPLDQWATPAIVRQVTDATNRAVPQLLAVNLFRQSRATKRLTVWRVAVRKAQSHAYLLHVAGVTRVSTRWQRSQAVVRVKTSPRQQPTTRG